MKDYEGMIVIHGDLYQIDKIKNQLVDAEWQDYTFPIAMLDMNLDRNGHIILQGYYDTDTKEIFARHDFLSPAQEEQLKPFSIPRRLLMGEDSSQEEVRLCNEQSLAHQDGYLIIDKELSDRLNGKLQVITIDGIAYKIDTTNLEISQADKPDMKFTFEYEAFFSPTEKRYNSMTKEPLDESFTKLSSPLEKIFVLTFPPLSDLDPVGFNSTGSWSTTKGLTVSGWKADAGLITFKPYVALVQSKRDIHQIEEPQGNPGISANNQQKRARKRGRHL